MTRRTSKWWLVVTLFVLVTPALLSADPQQPSGWQTCNNNNVKCQEVPDGGSAVAYLLWTGVACLGAMIIRSRASKPRLS